MAKEIVEIEVKTNITGDSVKDLRKQFNEVEDALFEMAGAGKQNSDEFRNLQREAAKIKERVDDLNESIDMLKPEAKLQAVANVGAGILSGFAAAQGAMQLFGAESEEVEKSIAKVQAAMALSEGIQGVVAMGDSFKVLGNVIKSTTVFQKAATAAQWLWNAAMAANPIGAIVAALALLVGAIVLVVKAMEDEDEAQKKVIAGREREIEVMRSQNESLQKLADFRKNLAAAQGKSAEEQLGLEKQLGEERKKRINEEIQLLSKNIRERTALIKNADDDERKEILDKNQKDVDARKALYAELFTIDSTYIINKTKLDTDNAKAEEERRKAARDKAKEDAKKAKDDAAALAEKEWQDALAEAERQSDIEFQRNEKQAERERQLEEERSALRKEMQDQKNAEQIKADEEEQARLLRIEEGYKQLELQKVEWAKQGLTLISDLNSLFAGKSEAQQKRAFEIDKATKIASATISGIEGTINAYKTAQASPITAVFPAYPAIQAGLAAAFAAVNVAKIAKTKFGSTEKAETGGGGSSNLGTFSQGAGGGQAPGLTSQNTVTQLNPDGTIAGQGGGQAAPMKAYVVESESRAVTERVNKLSNQSKIG
jgi:hypothetical protein